MESAIRPPTKGKLESGRKFSLEIHKTFERVRREVFIWEISHSVNVSRAIGSVKCWRKVEVSRCGSSWVANFRISATKDDSKKSRGDIGLARERRRETGKFFGCKSALTHNGKSFPRDRRKEEKNIRHHWSWVCFCDTHVQRGKLGRIRVRESQQLRRPFVRSVDSSHPPELFDVPENVFAVGGWKLEKWSVEVSREEKPETTFDCQIELCFLSGGKFCSVCSSIRRPFTKIWFSAEIKVELRKAKLIVVVGLARWIRKEKCFWINRSMSSVEDSAKCKI